MALNDPWSSTVKGVQDASTLRPTPPPRTPFSSMVEGLAPGPNDPRFHGDGRYGAPPNPPNPRVGPTAAPAAAVPPAPTAEPVKSGGWFKRSAEALRSPGKTLASAMPTAEGTGRFAGAAVRKLGPAAVGADALSHLNDYKINDPGVDSSAAGTFNALRQGDFAGARRSVGKGLLEAGMDLGSFAANTADLFVPGKAPVSTAYNQMLRSTFGDQLTDNTARPTTPAAPTTPTAPQTLTDVQRGGAAPVLRPTTDLVGPPVNPAGTITRTGNSYTATPNAREGADVRDPAGEKLDAMTGLRSGARGYGVSTIQGTDVYQAQQQLNNIRALGEGPNAAASGIGHISGTDSFGKSLSVLGGNTRRERMQGAQIDADRANALLRERGETLRAGAGQNNGLRIAELNNATARRSNDQNNSTALRGQDMELEGRMAPARLAAQQRAAHAQVYKGVGAGEGTPNEGHHLKAAAAFDAMGLKEQAAEARAAATSMSALKGAQDTQAAARATDTEKVFKPMFTRDVKDAQGNVKQEFDEVGAAKAAATVRGIYGEKFDSLSPAQKRAAYTEIAAKQKNQEAERQVMPSLGDAALDLVGLYDKPAEVSTPRDLSGGKPERAGLISRPGVDRNSTLLRLPNGQTVNYGVADAAQLEDIRSRLRP